MKCTYFSTSMTFHFQFNINKTLLVVVLFMLLQHFHDLLNYFNYFSSHNNNSIDNNDTKQQQLMFASFASAWVISSKITIKATSLSTGSFRIKKNRKFIYDNIDINNNINKVKMNKFNEWILYSDYSDRSNDNEIENDGNKNNKQQQQQQQHQRSYKLLTWNVLAPMFAPVTKYHYCNPDYVQWSYRYIQILHHLYTSNADIICLQEVQFDSWYDLLSNPIPNDNDDDNSSSNNTIDTNSSDVGKLLLLHQTATKTKTRNQPLEQEKYIQNFNKLITNLKERYHIIVQTVKNGFPVGCVTFICKNKFNIVGRLESRSRALIVTIQEKQQQQPQQQQNQQQQSQSQSQSQLQDQQQFQSLNTKYYINNNKVIFIVNCHLSAGFDTDVQRYYQIRSLLKRLQAHVTTISNPIIILAGDFNIINRQLSPIYNLLSTGKALVGDGNDTDDNSYNNTNNNNKKGSNKEKSKQKQKHQQGQKQQQLVLRHQSKTKEILKMQVKSNDLILPFLPLQDVYQYCYSPVRTTTTTTTVSPTKVKQKKIPPSSWNATATSGPTIKLQTSRTGLRKYSTNTRLLQHVDTITATTVSDKRKKWWMRIKKIKNYSSINTTKNTNDIVLGMTFASGHVLDYIWVSKCFTMKLKSMSSFVNGTTTNNSVRNLQSNTTATTTTTTTTQVRVKNTVTNHETNMTAGSTSSTSNNNKKKKNGKDVDTILNNDDTNNSNDIIMAQPWISNLTKASQQSRQYWPSKDNPSDHMPIGAIITIRTCKTKQ